MNNKIPKNVIYPITIGLYNSPCFYGNCIVNTLDTNVKIKNLKKNMLVKVENGWDRIRCIIKIKCKNDKSCLSLLDNNLLITPWHPIKMDNKWRFPNDINLPVIRKCKYVYNIIMKNRTSIIVNNTICCTLGHNITNDAIVKHDYFGTDKVINDLEQMDGWDEGIIKLDENSMIRNRETGLVEKLVQ